MFEFIRIAFRLIKLKLLLEGVLKVLAGHILCQAPDHDADHGDVDQGL
jgi:hypothetical protein